MPESSRPRRPTFVEPHRLEAMGEGVDPVAQLHAAHETAAVLLHHGRAADDPEVTARLVGLVDEIGLSALADLWATRPARTLPGALWRLYVLREWVTRHPDEVAREYAHGVPFTEPEHVVAGVDPPWPAEIRQVADQILTGVFTGDVAVAFERAAAFCWVVVAGRAHATQGARAALDAARLHDLGHDLKACADLWRCGQLD